MSARKAKAAPPPMDPVTVFLLAAGQACDHLRRKRKGRLPDAVTDPLERAELRKVVVQAMKEAKIVAPDQDDPAVHDLALNMIVSQIELLIVQAEIDAAAREAHEK